MNRVVHFEIPTDDLERAKTFYSSAFGWDLQTMQLPGGGEYTSVTTTEADETTQLPTEPGAINGGMMRRDEVTPGPVITIGVDAIDDALRDVESAGGATVVPRTAIPGMGAFAYFKDSEGNVMGLWESE